MCIDDREGQGLTECGVALQTDVGLSNGTGSAWRGLCGYAIFQIVSKLQGRLGSNRLCGMVCLKHPWHVETIHSPWFGCKEDLGWGTKSTFLLMTSGMLAYGRAWNMADLSRARAFLHKAFNTTPVPGAKHSNVPDL